MAGTKDAESILQGVMVRAVLENAHAKDTPVLGRKLERHLYAVSALTVIALDGLLLQKAELEIE
jgi:hypothetical protein